MTNIIQERDNGKLIGKNTYKKLLFELDSSQSFCVAFMHLILRDASSLCEMGKGKRKVLQN